MSLPDGEGEALIRQEEGWRWTATWDCREFCLSAPVHSDETTFDRTEAEALYVALGKFLNKQ